MGRHKILMLLVAFLLIPADAWGSDSLIIPSAIVRPGGPETSIQIRFVNEAVVRSMVVPLEIRALAPGCHPETLSIGFANRLVSHLTFIRVTNQYGIRNGFCQSSGEPSFFEPVEDSAYRPTAVTSEDWGLVFAAFGFQSGDHLPAGADSTGSMVIEFTPPDSLGAFEIDTVCIGPNNHLLYVDNQGYAFHVPVFVKGVFTMCDCLFHGDLDGSGAIDATDLAILIDCVFFGMGAPASDSTCPHVDRGDFNCDGYDDALDVSMMIDYVNFGGDPPCDPCQCDPYPTSCP